MTELMKQQDTDNEIQTRSNGTPEQTASERFVTPRASIFDTADAVVLELEMPGVGKDNVEITVDKDELTVLGRRSRPSEPNIEVLHQERLLLNFRRSFVLSERIDTGNISAAYENGVLRLTLPKSAEAKPRKISIS